LTTTRTAQNSLAISLYASRHPRECNPKIWAWPSVVSYNGSRLNLRPINDKNGMIKFTDDTDLIVPAECTATSEGELVRIHDWAQGCNLSLNRAKTKEIIFPATGPAISRTLSTLAYTASVRATQRPSL